MIMQPIAAMSSSIIPDNISNLLKLCAFCDSIMEYRSHVVNTPIICMLIRNAEAWPLLDSLAAAARKEVANGSIQENLARRVDDPQGQYLASVFVTCISLIILTHERVFTCLLFPSSSRLCVLL